MAPDPYDPRQVARQGTPPTDIDVSHGALATLARYRDLFEHNEDVIFAVTTLDVMMPGLDGWAVLTALKADPSVANIPVIMLTIVDDKNMGYALGAADYLTKPIDWDRLAAILQKYRCAYPPCTVLVVEDDADTRDMLRRLLTREGWAVAEASNGRVALERLAESQPELILLDLMMPEMDGFACIEALLHEIQHLVTACVRSGRAGTEEV